MSQNSAEETLCEIHPVMFRNSPVVFILFVLMAPMLLGIVGLLIWWLLTKAASLTITNKRVVQRRGLLSKHTTEVVHRDIRNIQVSQSMLQRLFGVGSIGISSSGQGGVEIQFSGIEDPESVKALIDLGGS